MVLNLSSKAAVGSGYQRNDVEERCVAGKEHMVPSELGWVGSKHHVLRQLSFAVMNYSSSEPCKQLR